MTCSICRDLGFLVSNRDNTGVMEIQRCDACRTETDEWADQRAYRCLLYLLDHMTDRERLLMLTNVLCGMKG